MPRAALPSPDYNGKPPVCVQCGEAMELGSVYWLQDRAREIWRCEPCGDSLTRMAQIIVPRKPRAAWV